MGIPDGAHTHGSGSGGAGTALLVLLAAAVLGPAVTAAAFVLLHLLVIIGAVILGLTAVGLVGAVAWRVRRRRGVPRSWQARQVRRAAQPLPASERAAEARAYLAVPQDFASLPPEVQQAVARELARALIGGLQRGDHV